MNLATFDRLKEQDFKNPGIINQIRECIRALEFYANLDHYTDMDQFKKNMTRVEADSGRIARKALIRV